MFSGSWSFAPATSSGSGGSSWSSGSVGSGGTWSFVPSQTPATTTSTSGTPTTSSSSGRTGGGSSSESNEETDPRTKSDIIYLSDTPIDRLSDQEDVSSSAGLKVLALFIAGLLLAKNL